MTQANKEMEKYLALAKELRREVLGMIYRTKSPHIGSSFSMIELFVALYFNVLSLDASNPTDSNRDRMILSKGHGCATLYAALAKKGILSREELDGFAKEGGILGQHPDRNVKKGIEITSGSLGHGLSIGAGMALAGKSDKAKYRIFVFLGDGELQEGTVWEGALFSGHHKLDNLVAIVDRNRLQALGKSSEIMDTEPLAEKWRSFGWSVKEVDGHNLEDIIRALSNIPFEKGKPSCLLAKTVKGKGVSFMEDDFKWHDKCPDEKEYQQALKELS